MAGGPLALSPTGASSGLRKRKAPAASAAPSSAASEEDEAGPETAQEEEEEVPLEELESEVADLGRRILERHRAAAGRLLDAAASSLAALRPPACLEVPPQLQSLPETSAPEAGPEILEKLELLKSKTKANIVALPKVLKNVDESTSRVEKLENLNVNIHPVFRRKR